MEITWYGHACFELKNNTTTIITDPFDHTLGVKLPELTADIVTVSHDNPRHNATGEISGQFKTLDQPGEYELGGVFITGYAIHPPHPTAKDPLAKRNLVFVYEFDDLTICHLGDIRHVPTQSQVEAFANVDVLLIPVGDGRSLNAAQAAEVIGVIEPAMVIPMHYQIPGIAIPLDPLDKFLKEIGLSSQLQPQAKLKISRDTLPEQIQTIILTPHHQ